MHPSLLLGALTLVAASNAPSQAPGTQTVGGPPNNFSLQFVQLQPGTPGTAQVGHVNVTGDVIAGSFAGSGAALTGLSAAAIATGTLADARLSSNVARLNGAQTFTGTKTFSASPAFNAAGAPFQVASATKVAGLNCDLLDGLDSSAFLQSIPVPLVLTSPGTDTTAITGTANNGPLSAGVRGNSIAGSGMVGVSGSGAGVWAESVSYAAVYAHSASSIGVWATADAGYGVIGLTGDPSSAGVWGYNGSSANAPGVLGNSTGGNGVQGDGTLNGVQGTSVNPYASGVYGESNPPGTGYGVAGRAPAGVAVYGDSASGWAVYSNGDANFTNDIYVAGAKVGFVADVVRNAGGEPLEQGDLVEIVGSSRAVLGSIPVIDVRKATSAAPRAVLGPIAHALSVTQSTRTPPLRADGRRSEDLPADAKDIHRAEGVVQPGAYAVVVTLGAFEALKVDASYGAVRPGDLLVASPNPGYAMVAVDAPVGTVVGKSLGTLLFGAGPVAVLVDQQ